MKVTDLTNLWVGYNETEDFRILILAWDEDEALEVAENYRTDSNMEGNFVVSEFTDVNQKFDCDYAISKSD